MTPLSYTKVSGKRRRITGSSQLWLGGDHLLLADTTWFVQHYRRFRLNEIQALVVSRRPPRYALRALLLAATLLLLAGAVRGSAASRFWNITGILLSGAALLLQVRSLAAGSPCRVVLHTAVTSMPLRAVGRMRHAEAFLAAVTPAIEAAQASLAPLPESPVESPSPAPGPVPPVPPAKTNWVLYYILFAGVTLAAGISFFSLLWTLNDAASLVWTLTILTIVIGIYLLASHRGGWSAPRVLCLLCTVAVSADLLITIYAIVENLAGAAAGAAASDPATMMERLSRWPGWFVRYSVIENPLLALAGLTGLLVSDAHARRERNRSARMEKIA